VYRDSCYPVETALSLSSSDGFVAIRSSGHRVCHVIAEALRTLAVMGNIASLHRCFSCRVNNEPLERLHAIVQGSRGFRRL
jgi:hypothetical protein